MLGQLLVHDLMVDISYVLLDQPVNTTLGTAVVAPGAAVVSPPTLASIYVGAQLLVGYGTTNREVVTVTAVGAVDFSAVFAHTHAADALVQAATFPTGYPEKQSFTQIEIMSYIADAQNEFLLKVRPVFEAAALNLEIGKRIYDQPDDAIRVEHLTLSSKQLFNCSQRDLDLSDAAWMTQQGKPTHWYQDELGVAKLGLDAVPQVPYAGEVWYAQRASGHLAMDDELLVPPVFAYAIKYGALSHVWEKAGEFRDPKRSKYAEKRFEFAIALAHRFMGAVSLPLAQGVTPPKYNPLEVEK